MSSRFETNEKCYFFFLIQLEMNFRINKNHHSSHGFVWNFVIGSLNCVPNGRQKKRARDAHTNVSKQESNLIKPRRKEKNKKRSQRKNTMAKFWIRTFFCDIFFIILLRIHTHTYSHFLRISFG